MTDEFEDPRPESEPSRPPGMPAEESDHEAALAGAGDFTSGEGLVAFAGMVVLAVWVVFDFIVDNYAMSNTAALVAAAAVLLPRVDRDKVARFHPLPILMKVVGYALVGLGVIEILLDLRFGVLDDFGVVIAALISYAGYAMAFVGARQIEI